jgi:hypothetical protein
MTGNLYKVLTVCLLSLMGSSAFAEVALTQIDGELTYVTVRNQQGNEAMVGVHSFSCNWTCTRSSKTHRVPSDALIQPSSSIVVESEGTAFRVGRDHVVLGQDGYIYNIRNVFQTPGESLVVATRERREGDSFSNHDGVMDPTEGRNGRNVYILNAEQIAAVEVDCYLNVCSGQRYQEVAGTPLCDFATLRDVTVENGVVIGIPELSCRVDASAPIDRVFNNGALLNGRQVFNPFPSDLRHYYQRVSQPRFEDDITDSAL